MHIAAHQDESVDRLVVGGELDLATTPQLRDTLLAAVANPGRKLVVDVSQVEFLDCTAVGMLMRVRSQAEERDCVLQVAGARGVVLEVLEIAGAAKRLGVYAEDPGAQPATASAGSSRRFTSLAGRSSEERLPDELLSSMLDTMTELAADSPERELIRTHVVVGCAPFATALARRFTRRGEPFDDLNQVAMVGLLKAIDGYDPKRGREFAAYATPTILGELRRHFRDRTWSMTVPRRYKDMRLMVNAAREELTQRLGRSPSVAELAEHLSVGTEEVLDAIEAAQAYRSASLFMPVGEDERAELVDVVGNNDPDLDAVEDRVALAPLIAQLPEREQRILAMRFYGNMTQSQIAEATGVSQMHVSRLLKGALARLREELLPGR